MRTVYIADDGKEFTDEYECRDYEWMQNHKDLRNVTFYNEDGTILTDIFSEDTYGNADRILVPNNAAVKDLLEFGKYMGFCCYEDITEP